MTGLNNWTVGSRTCHQPFCKWKFLHWEIQVLKIPWRYFHFYQTLLELQLEYSRVNYINTMAVDTKAPCVDKSKFLYRNGHQGPYNPFPWGRTCFFFLEKLFHFQILFPVTVIFLYETNLMQWILSQQCGYWWPGALAPGYLQPQCWSRHPCFSSCLWVNSLRPSDACLLQWSNHHWFR